MSEFEDGMNLVNGNAFSYLLWHFSTPASVVTYQQLKTKLSNHDIQLFDVRNPDEFQAGRIADAVNIPCK